MNRRQRKKNFKKRYKKWIEEGFTYGNSYLNFKQSDGEFLISKKLFNRTFLFNGKKTIIEKEYESITAFGIKIFNSCVLFIPDTIPSPEPHLPSDDACSNPEA